MLEKRNISLKYNRKAFEDAYKLEETGSLIRNKQIRAPFLSFIVVSVLAGISLFFSFVWNSSIVLSTMLSIIWIGVLIALLIYWIPLLKWRKDVKDAISVLMKSKVNRLEITESGFSYQQDEREIFESWSGVKSYQSNDSCIFMTASVNYILPKSIMEEEDYSYLLTALSIKVKNGL